MAPLLGTGTYPHGTLLEEIKDRLSPGAGDDQMPRGRTRFEKLLPVIGHVQIAAVPSRHEPDEGEVNYPAIFSVLDRLGYGGWIGCEYNPRAKTEDGLAGCGPLALSARIEAGNRRRHWRALQRLLVCVHVGT